MYTIVFPAFLAFDRTCARYTKDISLKLMFTGRFIYKYNQNQG